MYACRRVFARACDRGNQTKVCAEQQPFSVCVCVGSPTTVPQIFVHRIGIILINVKFITHSCYLWIIGANSMACSHRRARINIMQNDACALDTRDAWCKCMRAQRARCSHAKSADAVSVENEVINIHIHILYNLYVYMDVSGAFV